MLTRGEEALRGAAGDAYRASSGDGLAVLRTGGRRRRGKGVGRDLSRPRLLAVFADAMLCDTAAALVNGGADHSGSK